MAVRKKSASSGEDCSVSGFACRKRGTYSSNCHPRMQVALRRGQVYPLCPQCKQAATWAVVDPKP